MKKFITAFVIVSGLFMTSVTAEAQKIGYIRIDDIVGVMPEVQKVNLDTVGQKFIQDSVLPRYNYIQSEYNRKMADLSDTVKNPLSVRTQIMKEIQDDQAELNNAQNVIQQVQQFKQSEFLKPYYEKAKKAIDQVAKEKGYTYVLSTDVFVVAPEGDDITLAVLAKLNIKLPTQQQGQKPPASASGTKPPAKNN
jgi:outer membrane protein